MLPVRSAVWFLLVVLALDFSWASLPFRSYGLSLDDDADEEETVFDYNKFLRDPMKVPKPNAKVKIETLGSMLKGKRSHILVLFCTRKINLFNNIILCVYVHICTYPLCL